MIPIILGTRIITIKCIKSTVCWFVFVDIETKMPLYKKKTFPVSSIKFLLKMVLVLHQTIHASKIVHYIYSKKSIMLGLTSSHVSSSPWVESNQSKVTCFDLITLAGEATRSRRKLSIQVPAFIRWTRESHQLIQQIACGAIEDFRS